MEPAKYGTVNQASVLCALDLVPSIIEFTKVDSTSASFDGENLIDTLLGKSNDSRVAPIYFRRPPDRDKFYGVDDLPDLAMREGNWKLLCEYDGSDALLFDLGNDPSETNDVSAQQPEVVERMTKALLAWHTSMPPDNGDTFGK